MQLNITEDLTVIRPSVYLPVVVFAAARYFLFDERFTAMENTAGTKNYSNRDYRQPF